MQGQLRGLLLGCLGAQLRLQSCRKNKPRDCSEGRSLRCSLAPWPRRPHPRVLVFLASHMPLPKLQDKVDTNANHFQGKQENQVSQFLYHLL